MAATALLLTLLFLVTCGVLVDMHAPRMFDKEKLHAIANETLELEGSAARVDHVVAALEAAYPGHIHGDIPWLFVNCGGWMASMKLLHASLTEYVLIFAVPLGAKGHSGRYAIQVTDFMMAGEFKQVPDGSIDVNVYHAGDGIVHEAWSATNIDFAPGSMALEIGSGIVPTSLPFALGDQLLSAQDFPTIAKYFYYYGICVVSELLQGKI